ncbi:MAG: amino acid ABC transporter permease [Anaerolineales bacterium]|nr:amino acid ABC transporter permease [Anaerolineales bacterium]
MTTTYSKANILPPPSESSTLWGWARKNLFKTWYDTLLTFIMLGVLYALIRPLIAWAIGKAQWEVVQVNFRLLMVGQYPAAETWRAWLCLYLLAGILGLSLGVWARQKPWLSAILLLSPVLLVFYPDLSSEARNRLLGLALTALLAFAFGRWRGTRLGRAAVILWVLYFPAVLIIIRGGGLLENLAPAVPTSLWGGLMLTFLLTVVGILFSFPLGVLLALGRRSSLPAARWVSIAYIEVIRGVPLVTILFMSSVMVPLFLPSGIRPDRVLRAMVGITLFTAAYLAENVRGGLQAIPRGQFEAAHALGLSGFHTMALIILPQALRTVIPVIMGLFIALFKDTSLVATIGLLELLGISRSILAQPQYVSFQREVYLFISLIYWIFSYGMSYASRRLETRLGVGER